ncbi:hypothetical protein JW949_00080 [Candidatus Woesearchaeota archaeon]|nr:hypothetical protein [Candidatus Woesearchaeota archaeon]
MGKKDFLSATEKKVRKYLRLKENFDPKKEIFVYNDNSKEFFVSVYLLRRIFHKGMEIKEVKNLENFDFRNNFLIVPWNMEREINILVQPILNKKTERPETISKELWECLKDKKTNKKIVKLMGNITEEEIIKYSKEKKLAGKIKKEPLNPLVKEIIEKKPRMKYSIISGLKILEELNR